MFERFTDRAKRVVVLAREEARLLDHNWIGTEHILLGLIHEGEGVAAQALDGLGISLDEVRRQVVDLIGRGDSPPKGHVPFTPRSKKVLELSLREAMTLGHNYIGSEHILLGLVREGQGAAAQILVRLGADEDAVRARVLGVLGEAGASPEAVPGAAALKELRAPPRCPQCRAALEEQVAYRMLEVPEHEGTVNVVLMFVFCRACGSMLGTISPG